MKTNDWLSSREVEEEYHISRVTLCKMRKRREGPRFRKIGKAISYHRSVILAYIEACTVETKG